MWEKNYKQIIICTLVLSALWKTIKKLVITNFTKRCNIKKYWHGNHKKCSQKGFLTQLWHQKICHTQLWQKYICEKVYGGKKSDNNKYMCNCTCKISQNGVIHTGTQISDPPFYSFGLSRDYGMDLCLEVYLWAIYPYFTTFRVTTLSFYLL